MFNVGDYVRFKEKQPIKYTWTSRDALCVVCVVHGPATDTIKVRVVASKSNWKELGAFSQEQFLGPCEVDLGYFALATKQDFREFSFSPPETMYVQWFEDKLIEGGNGMKATSWLSDYIEKYKDTLFTIALVLVLDYYVFDGKFKQKLEDIVSGLLSKHTPAKEA